MSMDDKTSKRQARKRQQVIKQHYNAYSCGTTLYGNKLSKHILVLKKKLNKGRYFVIQNEYGVLSIHKIVYNEGAKLVNISKNDKQYADNRDVFDSWVQEAKENLNEKIRDYYDSVSLDVESQIDGQKYRLVLKKEYKEDYYFVLKSCTGKYVVANLVWFETVRAVIGNEWDFGNNAPVFYKWLSEAKQAEE